MSDIGGWVETLIAAGTPPAVAAQVVAMAFAAGVAASGFRVDKVDTSAERRRAWDRDRKRLQRGLRLSESEWLPLVTAILKRDGHKCTYCGATEKLTADHVVPLTRGGSNDETNLTACCIPCNTKKGNKLVAEWLPASSTVFHPTVHPNPTEHESASLSVRNTIEENRKKREATRGTRLPDDWDPSAPDTATADQTLGPDRRRAELEKFRDHWKQQPGSKGVKLDWDAAWRNWIRRAAEYGGKNGYSNSQNRTSATSGQPQTSADAVLAGMGRLASRVRERQLAERQQGFDLAGEPGVDGKPEGDGRPAHLRVIETR